FFRGSCHLFHAQMPPDLPAAPLAWACGDVHLENFGSYKGDTRLVYFDLNDFDEAALAPASWDPLRLLVSLRLGMGSLGLGAADAEPLSGAFLSAYAAALAEGKAYWIETETASGLIADLLGSLQGRKRAAYLDKRCSGEGLQRRLKVDGKKTLPATEAQRAEVQALMQLFAQTQSQAKPEFFELLDVARRVAGTGSLGLTRYVLLVAGKGGPDGQYLLDLKQAMPSALQPFSPAAQPAWADEAQRIVALQRRLQAVPVAFLQPVRFKQQAFVLRALQPTEDRVALRAAQLKTGELATLVENFGQLLAWAQLRSAGREGSATADALIAFGQARSQWQPALLKAAQACAEQALRDAEQFNQAYDQGAFSHA
ncbi:MAG: DUF2252 domain-containing protein, partial [Burkholderiaceae bacterium]|nr:DUF2252 domain-containing protein [Burkholderiaceae bacterium]